MKFVDTIKIEVKGGNGGHGVVSFLRELHRPLGGPDGGNGGNGGSVFFKGNSNLNTLFHLSHKSRITALNGGNGAGKNCQGSKGKDVIVEVPIGTIIKGPSEEIICNIINSDDVYEVAKGGIGGKGNSAFKTNNVKAPRICENGAIGESKKLFLELKLMANVGIIGYPNAGKSTLTSVISAAKPKIGDFEFTSLNPTLGIVKSKTLDTFVIADIPGLIEGASLGKGLGFKFLKHVERCEILIHLLNGEESSPTKLWKQYNNINKELKNFSEYLSKKIQIVVLNKCELLEESQINKILSLFKNNNIEMMYISSLNRINLDVLINKCFHELKNNPIQIDIHNTNIMKTISSKDVFIPNEINIWKKDNVWYVESAKAERLVNKIPLLNKDCYTILNKRLEQISIFDELRKHSIKDGEEINIHGYTFEWRTKK